LRSDIPVPLVYEEISYGPLPIGLRSQAAWSVKNACGSG
jgi:hypothetical protein